MRKHFFLLTVFILLPGLFFGCKTTEVISDEAVNRIDISTFRFSTPEPTVDLPAEQQDTAEMSNPEPKPTPFSVLWVSDTQHVPYKRGKYKIIGDWCAQQIEKRNIVQMIGTGDFVDACISRFQWDQFHQFLAPIEEKMPVFAICGNHDMRHRTLDYEPFRTGFYGKDAAYSLEQSYNNGQGRYMYLDAGGVHWIIIGMSYHYDENAVDWMREILSENRDRTAILCFHDYLRSDGELGTMAKVVFDTLIKPFENVSLVLCGHHDGYVIRNDQIDEKRFVKSIMCNEQADESRFGGVEFLEFDTANSIVRLHSESPLRENGEVIDEEIPIYIPDFSF